MKQDYTSLLILFALVVLLNLLLIGAENEAQTLRVQLELLQKSCEGR